MIGTVARSELAQLRFAVHEVGLQLLDERILASRIDAQRTVRTTSTVPYSHGSLRQLLVIFAQLGLQVGPKSSQLFLKPFSRLFCWLDSQFEHGVYVGLAKRVGDPGGECRVSGCETDADQAALRGLHLDTPEQALSNPILDRPAPMFKAFELCTQAWVVGEVQRLHHLARDSLAGDDVRLRLQIADALLRWNLRDDA